MFGQVIQCLVEDCGHEFAGFIDDVYEGEGVLGPFEHGAPDTPAIRVRLRQRGRLFKSRRAARA